MEQSEQVAKFAAILCSIQHAVHLSQCLDGSYHNYDLSPGFQCFTDERLEVLTAYKMLAVSIYKQLGQCQCFQAHNLCNLFIHIERARGGDHPCGKGGARKHKAERDVPSFSLERVKGFSVFRAVNMHGPKERAKGVAKETHCKNKVPKNAGFPPPTS